ncbi:protein kinase [Sorangium cellulosum]|uniref:Protein kinase n=1 Tax=Sorangium cellulosum TaxID=56 RepID=A0A2L0EN27_SORCE|nr:serine/threonine-protein kinase [Sorangium cellulosum]AUX40711.1 protein kinase [Sorangium cellulosum]
MGVVWAAHNEATSREVALKLLVRPDPELRVRLLQEARACGAVRHRNIVDIYDADETEGGDPFLVMPLLSGETLSSYLKRKRRLEPAEAARIARDIARGLAAAHERGIIHRDLKPSNIFLHTEPGESQVVVKLLDFGVSKLLTGPQQMRTATGILIGSPAYMSPEQVQAKGQIDPRADLWALGVVMFEMLVGMRPIQGRAHELLRNVLHGDVPTVAQFVWQIDPGLDALVSQCLQRDREQRPRSAADVAAALESFVAPLGRSRGGASSPDLRHEAPQPLGSSPRIAAVPAPANMTPLPISRPELQAGRRPTPPGGTWGPAGVPGTPANGAPSTPGIAAPGTPAPREQASSKPSNPLLGEFGTLKLSPEHVSGYRPRQHSAPVSSPQPSPSPARHSPPAPAPYAPLGPAAHAQLASATHAPLGPAAQGAPAPGADVVQGAAAGQGGPGRALDPAGVPAPSPPSRVVWIALGLLAAMLLLGLGMAVGFLVMRAGVESPDGRGGAQAALA